MWGVSFMLVKGQILNAHWGASGSPAAATNTGPAEVASSGRVAEKLVITEAAWAAAAAPWGAAI